MCGIAGFIGQGSVADIRNMTDLLNHRGPDAEGFWHDSEHGIFFGHKRLSIIDLSGGSQPMQSSDGDCCIIYNGEIYNHTELRRELEACGCRFQTDHSDTEVLLWGYKQWGYDFVKKLNGMWAFAIYDRQNRSVFFSRDRFGKKPLYYTLQNKTFAFSSELKSLTRHSNIRANISQMNLKKYFAYGFFPSPNTLFETIYKLPGGYNLVLNTADLNFYIWKYWDFVIEPFEKIPKHPEAEWGGQIKDLLSQAVKRRLMADVPLGVFLSGGIDSSSIAAFAAAQSESRQIKTFCIGFEEDSYDESHFSEKAAAFIGSDHYCEKLSVDKAKSILPFIVANLDEPVGDSSIAPTYLLCRETVKYVKVALGGDGADELFAGYDPFHALKWAKLYETVLPKPLHPAIRFVAEKLPVSLRHMSTDFKIKRALRGLSYPNNIRNAVWLGPLEPREIEDCFREPVNIEELYSEAIQYWDEYKQGNIVDQTLRFYTKLYLQDDILTKVDRASMLNSLEVRSPYLDIDLVNFVRKIPSDYKYRNGQTKYILKKALSDVLPPEIIHRRKHGFGLPVSKWFRDHDLNMDITSLASFVNIPFCHKYQNEHIKGKADHRLFLWSAWILGNMFIKD